jgi:hypothetical protein
MMQVSTPITPTKGSEIQSELTAESRLKPNPVLVREFLHYLEVDLSELVQDVEAGTPEIVAVLEQLLDKYRKRLHTQEALYAKRTAMPKSKGKPKVAKQSVTFSKRIPSHFEGF